MRSAKDQEKLLNKAYQNKDIAIEAICNSQLLDEDDINDCIEVIKRNDFMAYAYLDTIVRDHLMNILSDTFEKQEDNKNE